MKQLREAVHSARFFASLSKAEYPENKNAIESGITFLSVVPDCKSIVFDSRVTPEEYTRSGEVGLVNPDLPFQSCFLEVAGDYLSEVNGELDGSYLRVLGLFIKEEAPFEYQSYVLIQRQDHPEPLLIPQDAKATFGVVNVLLERLKTSAIAVESVSQTINTGTGNEKRLHTIREVIHIRKSKVRLERGPNGGKMDYTHRFEIRGHWRKIAGVGKDRHGSYAIKGATWVIPHVRGPEDKPLVVKQRVVHSEHRPSL